MIILGIETATKAGSAALVSEHEIVAEYLLNIRSYSEQLLKEIDQILVDAGKSVEECEAVAVSLGPGSFTGLRIGVSTAKALAFAIQKPVLGISTLEAMAHNLPFVSGYLCPMLDARKEEVYTALYQWVEGKLMVLISERVVSPASMIHQVAMIHQASMVHQVAKIHQLDQLDQLDQSDQSNRLDQLDQLDQSIRLDQSDQLDRSHKIIFMGNGSRLYEGMILSEFGESAEFCPRHHNYPKASVVAGLGLNRLNLQQFDRVEDLGSNLPATFGCGNKLGPKTW